MGEEFDFVWELHGFSKLDSAKQKSSEFEAGYLTWRLLAFPKQNAQPYKFLSIYLECVNPPDAGTSSVVFSLTIPNHLDHSRDFCKDASHCFSKAQVDWGFSQMLPIADINVSNGYLRKDGALVICVRFLEVNKRRKTTTDSPLPGAQALDDLLALLDTPGPTADITLSAGGRSFPAHRAILSARCEYFRTLFASGFSDSTKATVDLPDADPDALGLLLRFIYGGVLDSCARQLYKPAAALADRLRLAAAYSMLCKRLEDSVNVNTLVEDLLWADQKGNEELLGKLVTLYVGVAQQVDERDLEALFAANPKLLLRLHKAVTVERRRGASSSQE